MISWNSWDCSPIHMAFISSICINLNFLYNPKQHRMRWFIHPIAKSGSLFPDMNKIIITCGTVIRKNSHVISSTRIVLCLLFFRRGKPFFPDFINVLSRLTWIGNSEWSKGVLSKTPMWKSIQKGTMLAKSYQIAVMGTTQFFIDSIQIGLRKFLFNSTHDSQWLYKN